MHRRRAGEMIAPFPKFLRIFSHIRSAFFYGSSLGSPSRSRSEKIFLDPNARRSFAGCFQTEMSEIQAILDEIDAGLAAGNVRHRLKLLQHVTDLFVAGSRRYSGAEIALFDDVLMRLTAEIELEARERLARRL